MYISVEREVPCMAGMAEKGDQQLFRKVVFTGDEDMSPPRRRKRQALFAVTTTGGCMHACLLLLALTVTVFVMVAVCRATDEKER